jgi:SAM-dependent methyltransferase
LFEPKKKSMLHIAPEPPIAFRLRSLKHLDYVAADRDDPRADVHMDITRIPYPEASFDVICCSHVLEHIPQDRTAMRELCRVLKPDGWTILLVPIKGERTLEDPRVTDPAERERLFGQFDHVRVYGLDFQDRLEQAGFSVHRYTPAEILDEEDQERLAIPPHEGPIFLCGKKAA